MADGKATPYRQSDLPAGLATGILHLGLGAFHRAHQAAYTEDAIAAKGGDWGIEAVSMRNPALADVLNRQDCRYTLVERHPDQPRMRAISVIRRAHFLPGDPGLVTGRMADPGIHLVTVTVTEKGYGFVPGSRLPDPDHPAIAHDLAHPETPLGLIGVIARGLALRRAAGGGGMTLMSCDNLPSNGKMLCDLTVAFADRLDPGLARWIGDTCRFPDSMVDRITPAVTPATSAMVRQVTGHGDPAAVETEPFVQWVIQNSFAGPRPAWESAGALIVDDVTPFERMKLRMVNGPHSLIAYMGTIAGLSAVRDVMAVPELARLARRHMDCAAGTLPPLGGFDADAYADALVARFANPAIDHRCQQIAMDGSQKLPQRIFAPALAGLERGQDVGCFAFATAAWLRHIETRSDGEGASGLNDPMAVGLAAAMAAGGSDPLACVRAVGGLAALATQGLFDRPQWCDLVAGFLSSLRDRDIRDVAGSMR